MWVSWLIEYNRTIDLKKKRKRPKTGHIIVKFPKIGATKKNSQPWESEWLTGQYQTGSWKTMKQCLQNSKGK